MRRTLGMLGALVVVGAVVGACDATPGIQNIPLGFTIIEGLLEVQAGNPYVAAVVLSSTAGNCPNYQKGYTPTNIALTDSFFMLVQVQDGDGGFLPVTAGDYSIEMSVPAAAGSFGFVTEFETTAICQLTPTGANSGTITLASVPFDAGASSTVTYSMVYGYDEFTGSFPLTTCVIPNPTPTPAADAGYCFLPGNGGPI